MTLAIETFIPEILDRLPDIQAIYLFGSRATGDAIPGSDLDLAFLSGSTIDEIKVWKTEQHLATLAVNDVDLIDLRNASTVMRMQVIARGHRVYCKEERQCDEFEDFIFSDYARLNEERAAILSDIAQRGTVHG